MARRKSRRVRRNPSSSDRAELIQLIRARLANQGYRVRPGDLYADATGGIILSRNLGPNSDLWPRPYEKIMDAASQYGYRHTSDMRNGSIVLRRDVYGRAMNEDTRSYLGRVFGGSF